MAETEHQDELIHKQQQAIEKEVINFIWMHNRMTDKKFVWKIFIRSQYHCE